MKGAAVSDSSFEGFARALEANPTALRQLCLGTIDLIHAPSVSSTMDAAAEAYGVRSLPVSLRYELDAALPDRAMIYVADEQTAGRGRRGNQWKSSATCGLYASIVFPLALRSNELLGFPLAVCLALTRVLERLSIACCLKWPNDLLIREADGKHFAKLAGILIELLSPAAEPSDQVRSLLNIGIGINLQPQQLNAGKFRAISLAELLPASPGRAELLGLVLCELFGISAEFTRSGFAPFAEEWRQHSVMGGAQVRFQHQGALVSGRALDITGQGALLVQPDQPGPAVELWSQDVELLNVTSN